MPPKARRERGRTDTGGRSRPGFDLAARYERKAVHHCAMQPLEAGSVHAIIEEFEERKIRYPGKIPTAATWSEYRS